MVNIITCAYRTAEFAESHVEAILKQKGEWMHYVGVDGCPETLESYKKLKHKRMRLFYSDANVGKSMMQNTLVKIAGGNVLFFDSDDYMAPSTIHKLPPVKDRIFRLRCMNSDTHKTVKAEAIMYMNSETYFMMGGYRTDIKCSHDTCFAMRLERHSQRIIETLTHIPAFIRNKHRNALTVHPETALGSPYRLAVNSMIFADIGAGKYVIEYKALDNLIEI